MHTQTPVSIILEVNGPWKSVSAALHSHAHLVRHTTFEHTHYKAHLRLHTASLRIVNTNSSGPGHRTPPQAEPCRNAGGPALLFSATSVHRAAPIHTPSADNRTGPLLTSPRASSAKPEEGWLVKRRQWAPTSPLSSGTNVQTTNTRDKGPAQGGDAGLLSKRGHWGRPTVPPLRTAAPQQPSSESTRCGAGLRPTRGGRSGCPEGRAAALAPLPRRRVPPGRGPSSGGGRLWGPPRNPPALPTRPPPARRGRFQKVRARDPRRRSATPGARAVRAVRCGAVLRGAARSRPGAPRQERRLLRLEAQRPTPRATEGVHPVCPRRFCSSRYQTAGPAVLTLALFAKLWFASEPERRLWLTLCSHGCAVQEGRPLPHSPALPLPPSPAMAALGRLCAMSGSEHLSPLCSAEPLPALRSHSRDCRHGRIPGTQKAN